MAPLLVRLCGVEVRVAHEQRVSRERRDAYPCCCGREESREDTGGPGAGCDYKAGARHLWELAMRQCLQGLWGCHALSLHALLTNADPIQHALSVPRDRQRARRIPDVHAALATLRQQPLAKAQRVDLRRRPVATYDLHGALLRAPQPLRRRAVSVPRPGVLRDLRPARAAR
jgi:hypothetical protein